MIQISKQKLVHNHHQSFVTRFCAYNLLRYQVSVYRTIGHLPKDHLLYKSGFKGIYLTWEFRMMTSKYIGTGIEMGK